MIHRRNPTPPAPATDGLRTARAHSTPSQGARCTRINEVAIDGVYGYIYVADVTRLPPRCRQHPLFEAEDQPHPG